MTSKHAGYVSERRAQGSRRTMAWRGQVATWLLSGLACLCLWISASAAPGYAEERASGIRVILDSDANNELDDQHAIAYTLFNGDVFDVEAITVNRTQNGGGIDQQLLEAKRVVRLCGLDSSIPVLRGADKSFREIVGSIGQAQFDGSEAVNFIVQRANAQDTRKLVLLPVGKLSNIALALAKDPSIASKIRVVWLGSNYPEPGEYNQVNDEPALNYILDTGVEFEMAIVRYGKPSGTDAVRATLPDVLRIMPGKGPKVSPAVEGRHGERFSSFGDYSVNLFQHIDLHGNPPSRALFDMAAVAVVKNPSWAKPVTMPAPILKDGKWVERPNNNRKIIVWENFDRDAIMKDFYATMADYKLPHGKGGMSAGTGRSNGNVALQALRVSENKHFLVKADGQPFFWLGDTAWELFHRLNREEADRFLTDRARKGFTVIQAVALAEVNGHSDPNPYGHLPLTDLDPTRPAIQDGPANDYWDHVDYIVNKANELGLYIGFLPTWGRYWHDPTQDGKPLFTPQNAEIYGEWLGKRYKDKHLVWILGGDRNIDNDTQKEVIRAMARGLRKGDGGAHLITFHPRGGDGSSRYFHEDDWLDFNMRQNGHNAKFNEGYQNTLTDYNRQPIKPVVDGEPIYEDHPVSFRPQELGHSISSDVRRPLYWDLFTGAFGHTYGHHSVWQMWQPGRGPINNPLMPWYQAIDQPGAGQMQYGRWLMESRPFLTRVPDDTILVNHRSEGVAGVASGSAFADTKLTHLAYTREPNGKAVLYLNGAVVASGNVGGEVSNWEDGFRLALGNELTEERPWLGELYRISIYDRVLASTEISRMAKEGKDGKPASTPLALYAFREQDGGTIKDTSGNDTALDLELKGSSGLQWIAGGGVRLTAPVLISSRSPAAKITKAVKASKAITVEAWVKPENTVQAGPARIVTLSADTSARNFTLGQKADAYEMRFRTTATSGNGEPAIGTPGGNTPGGLVVPSAVPGAGRYRFVATRDSEGTYAMVYAPVGRSFAIRMDVITGSEVLAWWYNPRNGEATQVGKFANQGVREFTPPDNGEMTDWVLVLDDSSKGYPPPGTRK